MPPRGRRTRRISLSAAGLSNQWKASAIVTAATEASGSGIASARPSIARSGPMAAASSSRSAPCGSTAKTSWPAASSARLSLPVPAPRSSTGAAGVMPSSAASAPTTAGG
jgi:hypothetical protein